MVNDGSTRLASIANLKSPASAPMTIRFPQAMAAAYQTMRRGSFPGKKAMERGATIVADGDGRLSIQNIGGLGSDAGSFTPNLTVANPAKYTVVGVFHTHPYDAAEGWVNGVSFSGADLAYLLENQHIMVVAQSGPRLFAALRTALSPQAVDYEATDSAQNAAIEALQAKGRTFQQASRIAAQAAAPGLGLAYYQGKQGVVTRVSP